MAETTTQAEQVISGTAVGAGSLIQVAFWLAVIVGLILLSAWLLRRFSGLTPHGSSVIRVLTAISLGSRDRIALVQAGDKQILLGISPGRINTLHVFDQPIMPEHPETVSQPEFARKLQQFLNKGAR